MANLVQDKIKNGFKLMIFDTYSKLLELSGGNNQTVYYIKSDENNNNQSVSYLWDSTVSTYTLFSQNAMDIMFFSESNPFPAKGYSNVLFCNLVNNYIYEWLDNTQQYSFLCEVYSTQIQLMTGVSVKYTYSYRPTDNTIDPNLTYIIGFDNRIYLNNNTSYLYTNIYDIIKFFSPSDGRTWQTILGNYVPIVISPSISFNYDYMKVKDYDKDNNKRVDLADDSVKFDGKTWTQVQNIINNTIGSGINVSALNSKVGNLTSNGITESSLAEAVKNDRITLNTHNNEIGILSTQKANQTDLNTTNANVVANTNALSLKADKTYVDTQKSRIDNLVSTPNSSFYQKSTSGTTGALLVVSSGATTGQINLASVNPVATGYTPVAGDYVLLVYGVASGSAELIDARVGADGTTYSNVGGAVRGQINSVNDRLDGYSKTYQTYSTETGSGGNSIYKCSNYKIKKGETLTSVSYYENSYTSKKYLFVVDVNGVILDKYEKQASANGWIDITVGKSYSVDAYIAMYANGLRLTYTTTQPSDNKYYSVGLYESSATNTSLIVGQTMTFAQNVPDRYYTCVLKINVSLDGFNTKISNVSNTVSQLEADVNSNISIINLSDFFLPKCVKSDGQYTLIGRWFDKTINGTSKKCVNSGGSSILFKITGVNTITINFVVMSTMTTNPYYAYSIDGANFTRADITNTTITLPNTDEHFVWIVVDGVNLADSVGNNRWSGTVGVYLNNLSIDSGTMYAVKPKNKQILFIGDSIVEGVNVLGSANDSTVYSSVNEFSFKAARKLNAFPLLCGYGGTTTWSGVDWIRYNANGIPVNDMQPDIILIEYGYNDASVIAGGTKTTNDFVATYTQMIDILKVKYTGVPIICMIPFKQSLASYIRQVAANYNFCYVVETSDYAVTYTDAAHPDLSGAEEASRRLAIDIEKIFSKQYFIN